MSETSSSGAPESGRRTAGSDEPDPAPQDDQPDPAPPAADPDAAPPAAEAEDLADAMAPGGRADDRSAEGTDRDGDRPAAVGRGRRPGDRAIKVLAAAGVLLVLAAGGLGVRAAAGSPDSGELPLTVASPAGTGAAQAQPPQAQPPQAQPAQAQPAQGRPDGSWGPVSNQSPVAAPTERSAAGVRPLGLRIPAIGVDATSLVPLAIIPATGELEAPAQFDQTGWYAAGPVPGEPGPAVIAAHVDSRAGPAVFFRLKELQPGDKVYLPRSDGITVTFTVTGVERYPKDAFPTQKVHGPTPDRALRLITCGGSFDSAKRSYRDNIVVYAVRT